jgi:hypothetical protein
LFIGNKVDQTKLVLYNLTGIKKNYLLSTETTHAGVQYLEPTLSGLLDFLPAVMTEMIQANAYEVKSRDNVSLLGIDSQA